MLLKFEAPFFGKIWPCVASSLIIRHGYLEVFFFCAISIAIFFILYPSFMHNFAV